MATETDPRTELLAEQLKQLSKELQNLSKDDLGAIATKLREAGLSAEAMDRLVKVTAKAGGATLKSHPMAYHY